MERSCPLHRFRGKIGVHQGESGIRHSGKEEPMGKSSNKHQQGMGYGRTTAGQGGTHAAGLWLAGVLKRAPGNGAKKRSHHSNRHMVMSGCQDG